jgi:hypothetical protein
MVLDSLDQSVVSPINRFQIPQPQVMQQQLTKPKKQYEDELDQEILGNQNTFKSDQIALMQGF